MGFFFRKPSFVVLRMRVLLGKGTTILAFGEFRKFPVERTRTYIRALRQTQIYELVDCQIANLFIRKNSLGPVINPGFSQSCTLQWPEWPCPRWNGESICKPKQKAFSQPHLRELRKKNKAIPSVPSYFCREEKGNSGNTSIKKNCRREQKQKSNSGKSSLFARSADCAHFSRPSR